MNNLYSHLKHSVTTVHNDAIWDAAVINFSTSIGTEPIEGYFWRNQLTVYKIYICFQCSHILW